MIEFDYSFKKVQFGDLECGDFFVLEDKSEVLFIKVPRVRAWTIAGVKEEQYFNSYNLETNDFKEFSKHLFVIKCKVKLVATPQV